MITHYRRRLPSASTKRRIVRPSSTNLACLTVLFTLIAVLRSRKYKRSRKYSIRMRVLLISGSALTEEKFVGFCKSFPGCLPIFLPIAGVCVLGSVLHLASAAVAARSRSLPSGLAVRAWHGREGPHRLSATDGRLSDVVWPVARLPRECTEIVCFFFVLLFGLMGECVCASADGL